MRPINKLAAQGLAGGGSAIDREVRSQPVAFGRPTLHLNGPVTVQRRTRVNYIHAKLTDEQADRLFNQIFHAVTVRGDGAGRFLQDGARARAREMVIEELARIVGPHQIASPAKHPPFQALLDRVLEELKWLPPAAPTEQGSASETAPSPEL